MQTGFGAFLPVFLATHGWSHAQIGYVLSLAIIAALVTQIPGGAIIDALPYKRAAAGLALATVSLAAIAIGAHPTDAVVFVADIVQGVAASLLGPIIAAITLALVGHSALGERFGNNVRYAALGSVDAAAAMGLIGSYSHRAILFGAAVMRAAPTRSAHAALVPRRHRTRRPPTLWKLLHDRRLLIFVAAMSLFQLGNAALLPIATNGWSRLLGARTDLVVAVAIMLPQGLAALISPWFGRLAENYGRRLVLLLGFAVLPLRALFFAVEGNPYLEAAWQGFDGITAAAFGVMIPLVIADITHRNGRFNLTMGLVGVLGALGAALGNSLAGVLADRFGTGITFGGLGIAGLAAFALVATLMPETRDPAHHQVEST